MKRLIERIDSRLEGIDSRLESVDVEMRLSRESRERMAEDFRGLSQDMEARWRESHERMVQDFRTLSDEMHTRFERVVRSFEQLVAKNVESLDSVLDAVNAQSQSLMLRLPPAPEAGT